MIVIKGDMIKLNKFVHLYRLKELKEFGYYKFVPWFKKARIIVDLPSSFRYWKSRYFFILGDDWETPSGDLWGEVPRLLYRWGTLKLGALSFKSVPLGLLSFSTFNLVMFIYVAKKCPPFKSKYKGHVQATTEYRRTIEDLDDLVDPQTLAHHFLGL